MSSEPHRDQVSANEAMRLRRLVFYAADVDRFNQGLLGFVKKSGATSAMLIDQEGHLVARQGFKSGEGDGQALAALVAGSFTSTRQVAKILGEKDFRVMAQQGAETSMHITLLGERTLQVAVFPSSVKPGMIQVFCKELAGQMEAILTEAGQRAPEDAPQLGQNFSSAMKDQLDGLFGNL
jgi:predicted regulator of Ras-like GTPase activity (Roadblock/LC7/MglB family)